VREQPQIARISLAVMVDGDAQAGADGKPAWHERSADDIGRIRRLVQSAIGYDEKRGDKVEVVSMRFAAQDEGSNAPPGLFGMGLEKADMVSLAQSGILALVVLIALLVVLRPMALRLTAVPGEDLLGGGMVAGALTGGGALIAGPDGALVPADAQGMIADESLVNIANVEGQMRASAIRKLSEMVDKHPEETLTIMRGWLSQSET
jgi:flagellar M-ring protein FliF